MYKLYLSLKYFRSRLINIIPVVCMMLGVMALIVILAVMDGFQAQLRKTIRGTLSDLIIRVYYDSDVERWERVLAEIPGIRAYSPHLQSFALIADVPQAAKPGGGKRRPFMDGALVRGIDPDRESEVSSFREYLLWREDGPGARPPEEWTSSTPDPERPFAVLDPRWDDKPGIILGRKLADRLFVSPPRRKRGSDIYQYDLVNVSTMVRTEGAEEFRAEHWAFCVTGVYESGNQEIDRRVAYMEREVAKDFFQFSIDPHEIRIELEDYASMKDVVKAELLDRRAEIFARTARDTNWRPVLEYNVFTWEDERRNFLSAIENEKGLIAIICGMAFIVTGFMIFSILSMVVTMKTRDIGILKALGATTGGVLKIFVMNGVLVGVVGSVLGAGLGLWIVRNINSIKNWLNEVFGWEPFPQDIYLFSEIPTRIIPAEVAVVVGAAMLVALIGAILPALRASRLDPVEALRYE